MDEKPQWVLDEEQRAWDAYQSGPVKLNRDLYMPTFSAGYNAGYAAAVLRFKAAFRESFGPQQ